MNRDNPKIWRAGILQALPIMLGYIPVGFAYGVLAQKAGISAFNTLLMSVIVYAGSSQLIVVGLISSGMPAVSIIVTTFMVNLRHMLMSAALSPFLQGWRKTELAAFAFELTDETFAVHSTRMRQDDVDKRESFATNVTAQTAWIFGSWLGIVAGKSIADIEPLALDYALTAMFIALLVMQIQKWNQIGVAVVSGVLSVLFIQMGLDQWHVIGATIVGATSGVLVGRWMKN